MSDDQESDLLTQANNLNRSIKEYLANNHGDGVSRDALESFKTDIFGYLVDIGNKEFEEQRSDRLTKEGIEHDLKTHLTMINSLLPRGGGKRRKGNKRSNKKRSRSNKKRSRSNKKRKGSRKRSKY
jgi:hypothetical protein